MPGSEEMAMGAIAAGGFRYLNQALVQQLNLSPQVIRATLQREQQELARREQVYRGDRPPLDLNRRTVILIDDGLATGATLQAAIAAVKAQQPKTLVVAVPVAAKDTCQQIGATVDRIVCGETPQPFRAVGLWYEDFPQTTDREVQWLLNRQAQAIAAS
ncbi:hypothetical protein C7271_08825 [filamentous cyanobacterium CCP5]|nr:hypothetical protein C7271_08825 [filamentous cyanobacterium CCP5]